MIEEITSRKNPLIAQIKRLGTDKKARREAGEYFCQGEKLLYEAVKWNADIKTVLFCGNEPEVPAGVRMVHVPKEIVESISPMKSAPEVIFICAMPKLWEPIAPGRHLIMENMQDPGNVGTILRTADALDCGTVILAGDCADPFGPKAVRASMGAVFRHKITELSVAALIEQAREISLPIYAAALDNTAYDLRELKLPPNYAFAIGNEGHGLSREILTASAARVMIPMSERCESLNAAAAATVILWEMFRGKQI